MQLTPKGHTASAIWAVAHAQELSRDQLHAVEHAVADHVSATEATTIGQSRDLVAKVAAANADLVEKTAALDAVAAGAESAWTAGTPAAWEAAVFAHEQAETRLRSLADAAEIAQRDLADPLATLSRLQDRYPRLRATYGGQLDHDGLSRLMRALDAAGAVRR